MKRLAGSSLMEIHKNISSAINHRCLLWRPGSRWRRPPRRCCGPRPCRCRRLSGTPRWWSRNTLRRPRKSIESIKNLAIEISSFQNYKYSSQVTLRCAMLVKTFLSRNIFEIDFYWLGFGITMEDYYRIIEMLDNCPTFWFQWFFYI